MWDNPKLSPELDWDSLRNNIKKYGIRNSLLVAPMPTASTSQILGNNECFEPFTNNIYVRRTLAGEFIVINKHLVSDLVNIGIWNKDIKNKIIEDNGSIQSISSIPQRFKNIYKTVWETSNKVLINMAADRGKFICQSQSLNLFVEKPNFNNLSSMHMYSWQKGLKTGLYYLRTRPVAAAQKFTIEPEKQTHANVLEECLSCGS
jgi:ribonucleoside-diphosphate reductase alpha chain